MIEKHLYTAEEKILWFGNGEWVKDSETVVNFEILLPFIHRIAREMGLNKE